MPPLAENSSPHSHTAHENFNLVASVFQKNIHIVASLSSVPRWTKKIKTATNSYYFLLRKHWPRPRSLRVQPREINFFPQTFSESAAKARKRGARCAGTSKEGLRSWGAVTATPYTSLCHVEVCLFRRPARRQDLLQSFFGAFAK